MPKKRLIYKARVFMGNVPMRIFADDAALMCGGRLFDVKEIEPTNIHAANPYVSVVLKNTKRDKSICELIRKALNYESYSMYLDLVLFIDNVIYHSEWTGGDSIEGSICFDGKLLPSEQVHPENPNWFKWQTERAKILEEMKRAAKS